MTAALVVLLVAGVGEPSRNSVADVLAEQGLVLGIDFEAENPKAPHPSKERREAYEKAGLGAWLAAQTEGETDEISEPPPALRQYLAQNHAAVWKTIGALEKASPDWGSADEVPRPEILPNSRLQRLLLATALVEELDGHAIEAERSLEASWSVGVPTAKDDTLMGQMMRLNDARWQSGVLRKMKGNSLIWMDRLGRDDLWRGMIGGVRGEAELRSPSGEGGPSFEPFSKAVTKSMRAISDGLRKISPCDREALSSEALWKMAERELGPMTDEEKRPAGAPTDAIWPQEFVEKSIVPNVSGVVRRAARASIDRELTLRVLEVRLERQGSRDGKWPLELPNTHSVVCPEASYSYRSDGESMEIRFEGPVVVPDGRALPLVFRSGPRPIMPTATPPPPLTPSPEGGMMPPQ